MAVNQIGAPISFSAGTIAVSADVNQNFNDFRTEFNNLVTAPNTIAADTISEQTAAAGVTVDGVLIKDGVVTAALTGNVTGVIQTAAQPNITSLGTLTALQVDNLNINGNTISSTSGALNLVPLAGQVVLIDGAVSIDAGVVTGITSLTATNITGTLQTATQAGVNHDSLLNYVAAEHVDHTSVNISAGNGLSGGGSIDVSRLLALDINGVATTTPVATDLLAFHDVNLGGARKATIDNVVAVAALPAANLTGTVDSARLTGAYTGVTSIGATNAVQVNGSGQVSFFNTTPVSQPLDLAALSLLSVASFADVNDELAKVETWINNLRTQVLQALGLTA